EPDDQRLWSEHLAATRPEKLFLQLIDYSKDSAGKPGPDPSDGEMYVVTEVAECSLKDYIEQRRESQATMSKDNVRAMARAMMMVAAGLHAKGFVHLDLKPANLMLFSGVLKLIDVDGCIRIGTRVFGEPTTSHAWSLTLLMSAPAHSAEVPELVVVTCEPILKLAFVRFLRRGQFKGEASMLFMEWLGSITKVPLPKSVECFDDDLLSLLVDCLLVADPAKRRTLAESLSHPFVRLSRQSTRPLMFAVGVPVQRRRERREASDHHALHRGVLWKLSRTADPGKREHWYEREVWLSANGSLCYKSVLEDKQLVLIDGHQLANAGLAIFEGGSVEPAFEITTFQDDQQEDEVHVFGCASQEDYSTWMVALESARNVAAATMKLGSGMAAQLIEFRLKHNRRIKVEGDGSGDRVPVFKATLWKLKQDTDRSDINNWREREMWISQNGSLAYHSVREDRELVYYNADDLANATTVALDEPGSCKPWAFRVQLPAQGGVEFAPAVFAADSEDLRAKWIQDIYVIQFISTVMYASYELQAEGERPLTCVLRTNQEPGFTVFVCATVGSLLLGHYVLHCHHALEPSKGSAALAPRPQRMGFSTFRRQQRDYGTLGIALAFSIALVILGTVLPAFTVKIRTPFFSLGPYEHSLWSVGLQLPHLSERPGSFQAVFGQL
ncbi:unnamed protein product, partial [Prorocentrum cordatum]